MHQTCVFINQKQYSKSNELLTCIIKEAHHQGILSDSLNEASEAFQVKLNNKQLYLANWVRRAISNSYDAMTTSPVESINSHIKKRICASSLNNFSCSLLMTTDGMYKVAYTNQYVMLSLCTFVYNNSHLWHDIWTGTDKRISDIDNKAKQELQVTVISSKLAVKDIFHRKCVYMLNDFFDDRKNQKCIQVTESSWFLWKFELKNLILEKMLTLWPKSSRCSPMYTKWN